MQVAIAAASPLGRYLAELDGHGPSDLVGASVLRATSPSPSPSPSSSPPSRAVSAESTTGRPRHNGMLSCLRHRARCITIRRRLIPALSDLLPGFHDDVLAATTQDVDADHDDVCSVPLDDVRTSSSDAMSSYWWWWWSHQRRKPTHQFKRAVGVPIAVTMAGMLTTHAIAEPQVYHLYWLLLYCSAGCVLGGFVSIFLVEMVFQVLVHWHAQTSRQLETALRQYLEQHERFTSAFAESLELVKRVELAARGYRLGAGVLPPIGRVEESSPSAAHAAVSTQRMTCQGLRVQLRHLNEQGERLALAIAERKPLHPLQLTSIASLPITALEVPRAPSLLISALQKRHEMAGMLLETAVRTALVELVISMCRPCGQRAIAMRLQMEEVHALTEISARWTRALARCHMRTCRLEAPGEVDSGHDARDDGGKADGNPTSAVILSEFRAVSHALTEMLASCDTLRAVAMGCQHATTELAALASESKSTSTSTSKPESDSEPVETQASGFEPESPKQVISPHREEWITQLETGRQQMNALMERLGEDWTRLEAAMQMAQQQHARTDSKQSTPMTQSNVENEVHDPDTRDSTSRGQRRDQEAEAERESLLVFMGTSTGGTDFDLRALLRQHEQQLAVPEPVPSFVGELQDVLDRRTATRTTRTVIKRIGGDTDHDEVKQAHPASHGPSSSSCHDHVPSMSELQRALLVRGAASDDTYMLGSDDEGEQQEEEDMAVAELEGSCS